MQFRTVTKGAEKVNAGIENEGFRLVRRKIIHLPLAMDVYHGVLNIDGVSRRSLNNRSRSPRSCRGNLWAPVPSEIVLLLSHVDFALELCISDTIHRVDVGCEWSAQG